MFLSTRHLWLQQGSYALRPLRASPIGLRAAFVRLNSQLPQDFDPKKNLPSLGEWKHLKQHVPGESVQRNELRDRIPMFPLGKENVPTLLPRPGVPRVGPKMSFRQVVQILKLKRQPELIYESEPHRLYFLACTCMAVVFAVYGCVLMEFAWFKSNKDFQENVEELDDIHRKRQRLFTFAEYAALGSLALFTAYLFATFPTRLVRRMWYLPGPVEHVKFSSYPLIPGRPTPIITLPLQNLERRLKARVWTGKGFYGTADKSFFFFALKDTIGNKTWIVDRRGFFWSDGRIFDFLFGKESMSEAEAGIPYDEKVGMLNREVQKKKKEMRNKYGRFYQFKLGAEEVKHDAEIASSYVSLLKQSKNRKALPKDNEKENNL